MVLNQPRRRVLFSAYACGPVEEPEAGAGWAFATAAAKHADVWVITRRRFAEVVADALRDDPELAAHLKVIHIDPPVWISRLKKNSWDLYWYYALWQAQVTRVARKLHQEHSFDVLHHVTFANDWLPCGLSKIPQVPFVWGPVGGASHLPYWKLRRWLGFRGFLTELTRSAVTSLPRRIWGDSAAKRASLVLAQNQDVAERFSLFAPTIVEPNASLDRLEMPTALRPESQLEGMKTAVYAGRLMGLKGVRIALDALADPGCHNWRLRLYGAGYDRVALQKRAARLGITDRVEFLGHRPRIEVLAAFQSADAMLFPSMHDQAGWVAAEASSLGCPVVCLPLGGPPLLAEPNAFVASLDGDIIINVAEQLVKAGQHHGMRHNRWSRDRLPALVECWYDQVVSERVRPGPLHSSRESKPG